VILPPLVFPGPGFEPSNIASLEAPPLLLAGRLFKTLTLFRNKKVDYFEKASVLDSVISKTSSFDFAAAVNYTSKLFMKSSTDRRSFVHLQVLLFEAGKFGSKTGFTNI
jgi:hypothetical protein